METEFKEIEKEKIGQLNFPSHDVLSSESEINLRLDVLERAMSLGNLDQIKVKIYFEDDREKLVVDTTIWAVTFESVILKHGLMIPNHRIYKVI
ncbi:hypothetical protein [Algoriphagus sp.]|jgi:hypothetical protein|uniref:hypothetical protein n=1 Tax=Algoriphagus sp. TaxID=1872435 RepID=UPI0027239BDA|nr:hypothetical protein [Algoriphagus sp.]MDO8965552.1 hypothetical protein [Algoriphagus sp.]MDP3201592.1 hypothetical protein [Algoriphagus sp.]